MLRAIAVKDGECGSLRVELNLNRTERAFAPESQVNDLVPRDIVCCVQTVTCCFRLSLGRDYGLKAGRSAIYTQ
jgi:hypothetical protein